MNLCLTPLGGSKFLSQWRKEGLALKIIFHLLKHKIVRLPQILLHLKEEGAGEKKKSFSTNAQRKMGL